MWCLVVVAVAMVTSGCVVVVFGGGYVWVGGVGATAQLKYFSGG